MADLTSLANVKQWINLATGNTGSDALLTRLITSTSADFMRETNRPDLLAADYAGEVHTGDGGRSMTPAHWPINSVAMLTVGGVAVPASTDKIAAGYFFDLDIDPERNGYLYLIGSTFKDNASVVISYNAGYTTVPGDIEQAVIDWVVYRYKGSPNVGTQQRRSAEGETVQVEQTDLPPHVQQIIDKYTRTLPSWNRRIDERQHQLNMVPGARQSKRVSYP